MWDWYREWSQIARAAVKDGRLLIQLGLLSTGRSKRGADDEDDAPAPAPAPGPVD